MFVAIVCALSILFTVLFISVAHALVMYYVQPKAAKCDCKKPVQTFRHSHLDSNTFQTTAIVLTSIQSVWYSLLFVAVLAVACYLNSFYYMREGRRCALAGK